MESHLRHKSHKMHDFCFHNLEWSPQRYPQTFWLPSDFPGFDGGFSTPVDLFRWLDLFRSQTAAGVRICIYPTAPHGTIFGFDGGDP